LLHPSSLALDALRRFQLTPLRTAVAVVLVLVVLAFITVAPTALAFTVVAFTVVQPYAVGWP
jgi:di/tricarboxylate transporter